MAYQESLIAAGADVKEFKHFGSYQGTWLALLSDGTVSEGSYGSCSGCDSFEAEFGCSEREDKNYLVKLASFGKQYLENLETLDEIIARYIKKCSEAYAWEDDKEILRWLKDQKKAFKKSTRKLKN